jgi:hypothetical protein
MPKITVTPDPLQSGGTANVCIEGGTPNAMALVEIDDGGLPTPQTDHVDIVLDENGNGCATWSVPLWPSANFNSDGCSQVTREIT